MRCRKCGHLNGPPGKFEKEFMPKLYEEEMKEQEEQEAIENGTLGKKWARDVLDVRKKKGDKSD